MAKRRKHRKSKKHSNSPRRSRRHARRARRAGRRSFHRNDSSSIKELGMALVAGGLGYLASSAGTKLIRGYLPAMVPKPDIVAPAISGVLIGLAAEKFLRGNPKTRYMVQAGAAAPLAMAFANMAGLGARLGTSPVLMLPPAGPGGAPLSAMLNAALEAQLNGDEDAYTPDY